MLLCVQVVGYTRLVWWGLGLQCYMYGGVGVFVLVFYAMRFGDWYMECGCWFRVVTWCDGQKGHMGGNGVLMCSGVIPRRRGCVA